MRNAYRLLVGTPAGKKSFGRPRHKWVDNNKKDLKETEFRGGGGAGLYSYSTG
jgi:hypothetical protein